MLAVSLLALYVSTELLVESSRKIASYAGWSSEAIGAILISLATAMDEIITGAVSAVERVPTLGIGTLLGSTVVVTTFVPSLLVILKGDVNTKGNLSAREAVTSSLSTALAVSLLFAKALDAYTGFLLVLLYSVYVYYVARGEAKDEANPPQRPSARMLIKTLFVLFASILLLYTSAEFSVLASVSIADTYSIPDFIVGVLVLGLGVELPEIMVSMVSTEKEEKGMALSTILGSNTAKALLGLGSMATLGGDMALPLTQSVLSSAFFALASPLLLHASMRGGHKLNRMDAIPLLVAYVIYVSLVILRYPWATHY